MSESPISTDRRSFLKTGALAAAPLAAAAPVVALAGDDSRARLARLEDERAIEVLQRKLLRQLNGGEAIGSPGALDLGDGVAAVAEDLGHETVLELADDGRTATARCACKVEREVAFTGDTTLERMARFEGRGSHRHEQQGTLTTEFVKDEDGWTIVRATLA